uniref:Uncharacterized protein n=2 Tax=Tetraselmis sp. GSL018 TaxID=582737 RepID=A0A061RR62_9CHLO
MGGAWRRRARGRRAAAGRQPVWPVRSCGGQALRRPLCLGPGRGLPLPAHSDVRHGALGRRGGRESAPGNCRAQDPEPCAGAGVGGPVGQHRGLGGRPAGLGVGRGQLAPLAPAAPRCRPRPARHRGGMLRGAQASLPQGWQRVSAFGQLCRAAVDLDLSERRNAWDGGTLEEDLLLPSILEDRAVKDLLRPHGSEAAKPQAQAEPDTSQDEGSSGRSSMRAKILGVGSSRGSAPIPDPAVAPKAQGSPVCPEAPEELMATLLQTALEHPQAADEPDPVFNADAAAAAAASREKARTALDWVRMALEAARPMQGCLSREPLLPLVPDLWLVEMQRCAAVVRGLLGRWRSSGGPSPGEEREEEDGAEEAAAEEQGGGTGGWRCEAEEARKALQGLLLRVMAELPRAAPSMRPRAMWDVHNLGLGPREGATWRSVLEALWDLAAAAVKDTARINAFVAAASEGVLPRLGSPAPEQGPLSGAGGDPYGLQLQSVVLCLEHLASLLTVANDAPELTEKPAAALVSTVDDDHREASVLNLARQLNKLAELLLASPRVLGPDMEDSCRRLQRQLIGMQASAAAAEGGETAGVIPASGKGLLREADLDYSEGYPFSQAPGTSRQAASRASKLEQLVRRAVLRAGERAGCTAGAGAGPRRGAPAATAMSRLGSAFRGAQHCEVPSPAEMGASLGGLLPDAPGSAAARAAGAGASGAPWVALTGASDPVQILARHTIDLESNTATIHLRLSNAMPGAELEGVSVCLSVLGPVHPDSKQPNLVWRLPKLDPQETHAWESRLWISGFGRPKLFPRVTLAKGRRESQTVDLGIRCRCYEIPLTDLLKAPPAVPPARSFFQAWDSLPARWEGCAVAFAPGSAQAPAIASALQDCTPFAPVWLSPLDALCGFQGAFQAITWGGEQVALVIMSQLLPLPGSEAPAAGESVLDTGRQVVRLCIRSSWQEVTTAIEEDSAAWVRELFGGLVSHGPEPPPELSPAVLGQRPTALLKAAPAVAPLRSQSGLSHRASEADLLSDQGEANEGGGLAAWELSEEESLVNRASLAEWRRLACA